MRPGDRLKNHYWEEAVRPRLEYGPDEIAGRDHRGPARQRQADPQNDLRVMRPRRDRGTRRPLDEESAEPAEGGIVGATGHMRFQLA